VARVHVFTEHFTRAREAVDGGIGRNAFAGWDANFGQDRIVPASSPQLERTFA
jgi:hypothetical protein